MQRTSLITLLSNYACDVAQRGALRLVCTCRGNVVTAMLACSAAVAALSVVAFPLLVMAGGDRTMGIVGVGMALLLAGFSIQLAVSRYRKHGEFVIDGEAGVLQRYRAGRMTAEFGFENVTRVWTVLDPTDSMGLLSGPPRWLQIGLDNGEVFRVAKGSPQELEPVCDAIRKLGLAIA